MIIGSFLFFLAVFVVIGVMSTFKYQGNTVDYLMASHNIQPWLVSLSAVATNNSGYMFVGMIGFTYVVGLSSIWLMIGWITGDLIMSFLVHKKLRIVTHDEGVHSFGGALARWGHKEYKLLRALAGLITVVFLCTYAGAQLQAGSKALHVLFDWNYHIGAIVGAMIVVLYCFSGGIRASIWTDAAQSFVMIIAMAVMLVVAVNAIGGIDAFWANLNAVSPTYLDLFTPGQTALDGLFGPLLFVGGWVFAGFGIIGQPHIMVRFMVMDQPAHMTRVRIYYYSWYIAFYSMTIGAGLAARLLLPDTEMFDPELALPALAVQLLPDMLAGLVLAGLFAATMSTADSQILSCSAAVSHDFGINKLTSYWAIKAATVLVTAVALGIALFGSDSVFVLVLIAWSVLGAAFGPLLMVYAFGGKPNEPLAILMVLSGISTVLVWRYFGLSNVIYEIAPGIITGIVVYCIGKVLGYTGHVKTPQTP